MFSSEDIQSIFILIFTLLVRLDGILACLTEEEKLSPFFKLEGFLMRLFTLTEWWPEKLTQCPCGWRGWVGGWRTSQRAVRADLGGRASAVSA